MELDALSLRDVAMGLGSSDKVGSGKLLSVLKSGKLKAGLEYPVGEKFIWVEIPTHFWKLQVTNDNFKIIRQRADNVRSGAFKVRVGEFADELVSTLEQELGNPGLALSSYPPSLAARIMFCERLPA